MKLNELNPWWTESKVKPEMVPAVRRELFFNLQKDLSRRMITVVVGLRRVGKSTLIFQLIEDLIKSNVSPLQILYCTFDEPNFQSRRIEEILEEYSSLTGIDFRKEKVYLFLDEIQKAKEWVASTKLLYDHYHNIKIVVSGSASLPILAEAKKSLAGRAMYYELKPLHFKEFLQLKGIKFDENKPVLYEELLKKEFRAFLYRPFPALVKEADILFIKNYIREAVIEPILLKDIPKEFKDVDILLLEKLVNLFLGQPGQIISIDDLAKELGRAKATLYKALFYLEFSFLIKRVLNFRPSLRAASRKLSKIYPYHPCLTLPYEVSEDKYAESLVGFELEAKYYWRDKEKEIDFLKESLPVEVKYSSEIRKNDLRWVEFFLEKYGGSLKIKKAFLITRDVEGQKGNIFWMPLWKFCFYGLD